MARWKVQNVQDDNLGLEMKHEVGAGCLIAKLQHNQHWRYLANCIRSSMHQVLSKHCFPSSQLFTKARNHHLSTQKDSF